MVLLKAVGACEYVGCSPGFCEKYNIRHKAMLEIRKLRTHLTNSGRDCCLLFRVMYMCVCMYIYIYIYIYIYDLRHVIIFLILC